MAKFYRFNPKGEILVEKTFDEVSNPFGKLREFVPVKKGKKWGVALNDTLELIVPLIYDRIEVWLFDKSVLFLNYFDKYGSNYVASSVWICVSLPIAIYAILIFLIFK